MSQGRAERIHISSLFVGHTSRFLQRRGLQNTEVNFFWPTIWHHVVASGVVNLDRVFIPITLCLFERGDSVLFYTRRKALR